MCTIGQLLTILSCRLRRKYRVRALVLLFVVISENFAGCDIDPTSEPTYVEDVLGTYEPTYKTGGSETIVLRVDSTYTHMYADQEGITHSQEGRWGLVYILNLKTKPAVILKAFVNWYPLDGTCYDNKGMLDSSAVDWGPNVYKTTGGIVRLVRCPNIRQYYVKVKL